MAIGSTSVPEERDAVGGESGVSADQGHPLDDGMGDDEADEGILVVEREGAEPLEMPREDGQERDGIRFVVDPQNLPVNSATFGRGWPPSR